MVKREQTAKEDALKRLAYIEGHLKAIRKMVERDEGVAFLPRMCVEEEITHGLLREVKVKELEVERKIRLVYPARRALSHAAAAFLELVGG